MVQRRMGCERSQTRLARADRYSLALQIFASLDARMDHHNVPDVVLVAHEHDQVSARNYGVSDMGRANQSDVDLSRQHRLGSARSDNEYGLDVDIMFAEKALFPRDPNGGHVGVDGTVSKHCLGWILG